MIAQAADQAAAGTSIGALVVTVLISSGFTSIVVVVITAFINRRNLNADTSQKISDAAGVLLDKVNADNDRLRTNEIALERRVSKITSGVRVLANGYLETLKDLEQQGIDVTARRAEIEQALHEMEI